ncbi:MAG: outer membrane beta-barrel protein [Gammaproteobacteria bacterium]|nr:outer membrane beta-barrel protein [Gammaproteobacteria bacterium]MDH5802421.1 outer membrane beta-barrel protein [Gammaproteobacteria bacterium]
MRILLNYLLALVGTILPFASMAQSGDQYYLPKLGQMVIDINKATNLNSIGLMYGYGITKHFSLEAELNSSLSGGTYTKEDALGNVTEKGEYQVRTLAAYAAVRKILWGSVYAKGKVGVLFETVERSSDRDQTSSDDSIGFAGGLGAGAYLFEHLTMELEATQIDRNIVFYSLGMHIRF